LNESPELWTLVWTLQRVLFRLGVLCLVLTLALGLLLFVMTVGHRAAVASSVLPFLLMSLVAALLLACGSFRFPTSPRGSWLVPARILDGHRYWRLGRTIEVDVSVSTPAILGRRELEEIAAGEASRRTGSFAVKPEFRDAVSVLLASGEETVLFLEAEGVRFEGYRRGRLEEVVRALVRLAGPGFVLARHEGTGVCPYCKEAIASERASCESCGVEHHAGCLAEHGGCAIFGCERAPSTRRPREKAS
jgi:hypothetical protein